MVCGIQSKSYCLVCGILSKSYFLVCRGVRNHVQILLSCLLWCEESYPNPTVLSAMVCGIPSKSYCLVCYGVQIPIQSLLSCLHGVCNPIQILLSSLSWCAESHPNPTIKHFLKIQYSLPRFAVGLWFETQVPSRLKIICRSAYV